MSRNNKEILRTPARLGDPFGQERLERILCGCTGQDPREILQHILGELSAHSRGRSQRDDITLVVMQAQA